MESNRRHEFRVEIEGIELPDDVLQRINSAVRQAVLTELSAVNLQGRTADLLAEGLAVKAIGPGAGHGGTQGVHVRPQPAL
jgi:hypothetical protein